MQESKAFFEVYDGAVYMHQARVPSAAPLSTACASLPLWSGSQPRPCVSHPARSWSPPRIQP